MGKDIGACAQTGSGKTFAHLVSTISKLMGKAKKVCAPRPGKDYNPKTDGIFRGEPLILIVVPRRELAVQIFNEARRFCYRTRIRPCVVYGGAPVREQIDTLADGCGSFDWHSRPSGPHHPGDAGQPLPEQNSLSRDCEANKMLAQGFKENLRVIIGGDTK